MYYKRAGVLLSMLAALAFVATGCGKKGNNAGDAKAKKEKDTHDHADHKHDAKDKDGAVADKGKTDDHSGWWCDEHGIPEEECSMCNGEVAAKCKKKGDWCDAHDRAKSQCFKCDPKLKEEFAAKHRAKLNKEPPPIGEEKPKKDG